MLLIQRIAMEPKLVYRTSLQNIGSQAHVQGDKIYLCCFLPWDLYEEFLDLCEVKSLQKFGETWGTRSRSLWTLGVWDLGFFVGTVVWSKDGKCIKGEINCLRSWDHNEVMEMELPGAWWFFFLGINLKKHFIRPFIRPILSDTKGIWQVPGKKTWTLKIPKKRRFGWRLGCACIRLAIILPAISGIPAENTLLVELVAFLIPLPIW